MGKITAVGLAGAALVAGYEFQVPGFKTVAHKLGHVGSVVLLGSKNNGPGIHLGKSTNEAGAPDASPATTQTTAPNTTVREKVVVIDPGHAGANTLQTDPITGIKTAESAGAEGERAKVWTTSTILKSILEKQGYKVVLTKNSETDPAGLVTKANLAMAANPDIVVSIHCNNDDPAHGFGTANPHWGVTPQVVGEYRQNNDGSAKITFSTENTSVADKSQEYAQHIVEERNKVGDHTDIAQLTFPATRSDTQANGNEPLVMLLDQKNPWIYNEASCKNLDPQVYATGLANGIMASIGPANSASNN